MRGRRYPIGKSERALASRLFHRPPANRRQHTTPLMIEWAIAAEAKLRGLAVTRPRGALAEASRGAALEAGTGGNGQTGMREMIMAGRGYAIRSCPVWGGGATGARRRESRHSQGMEKKRRGFLHDGGAAVSLGRVGDRPCRPVPAWRPSWPCAGGPWTGIGSHCRSIRVFTPFGSLCSQQTHRPSECCAWRFRRIALLFR